MRQQLITGAGLLLVCLLGLTGCAGGGETDSADPDSSQAEVSPTQATPQDSVGSEVQDLVGQEQSVAEEQLRDLGVRFDTKTESSPQTAGTVIAQEPDEGTPINGDGPRVTLTVAGDPPAVPDVEGSSIDDARRDLEKLGFTVVETDVFAPDASNGEVVGQDPNAGSQNVSTVTLEVSRPPQTMPFKDTRPITSGGYSAPQTDSAVTIGGEYAEALVISAYGESTSKFGINLAGGYSEVEGRLGIETSDTDTSCKATVSFTDEKGRPLGKGSYNVTFTHFEDVKFSVADVVRLNIDAHLRSEQGNCGLVFGDFQATGLKEKSSSSNSSPTPPDGVSDEPSNFASSESTPSSHG